MGDASAPPRWPHADVAERLSPLWPRRTPRRGVALDGRNVDLLDAAEEHSEWLGHRHRWRKAYIEAHPLPQQAATDDPDPAEAAVTPAHVLANLAAAQRRATEEKQLALFLTMTLQDMEDKGVLSGLRAQIRP